VITRLRKTLKACREWFAELGEKFDAVAAADAKLAEVYERNLRAGIDDETPEWNDANSAAWDAVLAVPLVLRLYAQYRSDKANHEAYERIWKLEDTLACRGDSHAR
jgi:hypothetical protein